MSDFFELVYQDKIDKAQAELVEQKKHEFHLIRRQRKIPGHIMFSYNTETHELKVADVEHCKDVSFITRKPLRSDKIVIEKNCIYFQSLNMQNAIKRLKRMGYEQDV